MSADAYTRMAHLLRRAGFGARPDEINNVYLKQGFEATVDQLVNYENVAEDASVPPVPSDTNGTPLDITTMNINQVSSWWITRMVKTKRPLQEKLVLFWHNHFATSYSKVSNAKYLYWQNKLFRDQATGNFRTMLKAINRDPAMLIWLDSVLNNLRSPNENYARELQELFSLGFENFQQGAYTEADVQQAARAFTGWALKSDPSTNGVPPNGSITDPAQLINIPPDINDNSAVARNHDYGNKIIYGVTQNFNGDQVVDLILDHEPQRTFAAKFIGKKLFKYFAHENPSPEVVDHLANVAKRADFNLKAMLRDLFLNTKEFYSDQAINSLIRWPAHYVISSVRLLQASVDSNTLISPLRDMGQQLFFPPDVFGWPGDYDWISTGQMFARVNWANTFATNRSTTAGNTGIPIDPVLATGGLAANATAEQVVDYFISLLVQSPLDPAIRQGLVDYLKKNDSGVIGTFSLATDKGTGNQYKKVRGLIHLLLSRPEYQNN